MRVKRDKTNKNDFLLDDEEELDSDVDVDYKGKDDMMNIVICEKALKPATMKLKIVMKTMP